MQTRKKIWLGRSDFVRFVHVVGCAIPFFLLFVETRRCIQGRPHCGWITRSSWPLAPSPCRGNHRLGFPPLEAPSSPGPWADLIAAHVDCKAGNAKEGCKEDVNWCPFLGTRRHPSSTSVRGVRARALVVGGMNRRFCHHRLCLLLGKLT